MGIRDEAIEIEYWRRPAGGWAAICLLTGDGVGITVAALTRERVFAQAMTAMEHFWDYAGRQASPPPNLRLVLRFRRHPLRFRRVPPPAADRSAVRSFAIED